MDWGKVLAIVVSIFALSGVVVLQANGIRADMNGIRSDIAAMRTEAGADRRAMQAGMDTFRQEMIRLAERQVRTEARVAELSRLD